MPRKSPHHEQHPSLRAVGDAIRGLRLEFGQSQEALALEAEIEIDRFYLGGIERGEHNLTLVNLTKVAVALGLSVSDLLKRAGL